MFDRRTLLRTEVLNEIHKICEGRYPVFDEVMRSVRFAESPLTGGPIKDYATELSVPYEKLAEEVDKR
jgi:cellulose biosynthesis protein BcsQ